MKNISLHFRIPAVLVLVGLFVLQCFTAPSISNGEEIKPSILVGTWLGKKLETYTKDGRWLLRKYEGAEPSIGKWSLNGNQLTVVNSGGESFIMTIVSISKKKMVLSIDGGEQELERVK